MPITPEKARRLRARAHRAAQGRATADLHRFLDARLALGIHRFPVADLERIAACHMAGWECDPGTIVRHALEPYRRHWSVAEEAGPDGACCRFDDPKGR